MAAKIIKFPNASKRKARITDVLVDKITDMHNHAIIGYIPFTCAECNTTSTISFNGVVFKTVTFYCNGCGHGYTVSNPMFTAKPGTNSK